MSILGANAVDVVVLLVLIISSLLAFARGFVAEVFSIAAWAAAAAALTFGYKPALPIFEGWFGKGIVASVSCGAALFLITLAVVSIFSYILSRQIRATALSAVDRSLGFLFGLARGVLLVCIFYLILTFIWPMPEDGKEPEENTMQAALLNAKTQGMLAIGADQLRALAPEGGIDPEKIKKPDLLENNGQPQLETKPEDKPKEGAASEEESSTNPATDIKSVIETFDKVRGK